MYSPTLALCCIAAAVRSPDHAEMSVSKASWPSAARGTEPVIRARRLPTAAKGEPLPFNGCFRMHGGPLDWPRTAQGKARCAEAALRNLQLARAALALKRTATVAPSDRG